MYRIAFVFFVLALAGLSGVGGDNNNLAQYGNMDDTSFAVPTVTPNIVQLYGLVLCQAPRELVGGPVTHE
jgi:hypothetical protein